MASVHYLKITPHEAVVKMYSTEANGETVDLAIENLATADETFNANTAVVTIQEVFWGVKHNKHIDISRKERGGTDVHGHYFLVNSGSYDYDGFVDDVYSNRDIRIVSDGEFHCIMKLKKTKGYE